jgi:glucan 1,3-beta-glucosidase
MTNNPVWALNKSNITRTVDTIRFLAKTVGSQVSVIELLNEAGGYRGGDWTNVTRQFWLDGYSAVREVAGLGVQVMIGDAFLGINVNFLFGFSLQ